MITLVRPEVTDDVVVALSGVGGASAPAPVLSVSPGVLRTVMLIHGDWHGSWCWSLVTEQLAGRVSPRFLSISTATD